MTPPSKQNKDNDNHLLKIINYRLKLIILRKKTLKELEKKMPKKKQTRKDHKMRILTEKRKKRDKVSQM